MQSKILALAPEKPRLLPYTLHDPRVLAINAASQLLKGSRCASAAV